MQGKQDSAPPLAAVAASLIGRETNEHRTSNIEHSTSNNEFCQSNKRLGSANLPLEILQIGILWSPCFKIDKA
jgi:hypothetical protein